MERSATRPAPTPGAARTATLNIGGSTVTVTQAALICSYCALPGSGSVAAAAGSGTRHRLCADRLRVDRREQRLVADRDCRRLGLGQRDRHLRGRDEHRHDPHRESHGGRPDIHRHAGDRMHLRRVAVQRLDGGHRGQRSRRGDVGHRLRVGRRPAAHRGSR